VDDLTEDHGGVGFRPYTDRADAGRALAALLGDLAGREDVIVLGLPRGGVPVAAEVAAALGAPLDVFVVRKLGVPGHEELAMGALASGHVRVLNEDVLAHARVDEEALEEVTQREAAELRRRERLYRGDRPAPSLAGRVVVLVDDGLATGSTMRAAVRASRRRDAARIVVAVPVAPWQACEELSREADDVVCAACPEPFAAVGVWYRDFAQTSDDEVRALLLSSGDGGADGPSPLR
jgi:predicted phosphoribosyltransferase